MAEADEDAMPRPGLASDDADISDEVQDFRFLASISRDDARIPKRGEKDFEPHSTDLQANTLSASRRAMHDALSFQRTHPPRHANLAIYHAATNSAFIDAPKSTIFRTIGANMPKSDPLASKSPNPHRLWLLPEEALYLIERGTVDCRWPDPSDPAVAGLPMSVQGAHAVFLGLAPRTGDGLTFERYTVYASLRRAGYVVRRAATWAGPTPSQPAQIPGTSLWSSMGLTAQRWRTWLYGPSPAMLAAGPLASKRIYRSYRKFTPSSFCDADPDVRKADIYRSLSLIPFHDPTLPSSETQDSKLRVSFDIWKPSNTAFKKSNPRDPDFRIAVLDARMTDLPSLEDLGGLMDDVPFAPPQEGMSLYARLKHGHKSVVLAVVDQGVTSFLRVADAGFGREEVFYKPPGRGTKGPGRGGKGGGGGKRGGRGKR